MKAIQAVELYAGAERTPLLQSFNLAVEEGEIVGFIGPNDAGKSTLLRIIAGILPPASGQCFVYDRSVRDTQNLHRICDAVTRTSGLYEQMNGLDNLLFFASLYEDDQTEARLRASALMKKMGLWDKRELPVEEYTGGERLRLSFARALLHEPKLLLYELDGELLDGETEKRIHDILTEQNRENGLTVCIFADRLQGMENICTDYVLLENGNLLASGNYEYLRELSGLELTCRIRCSHKPKGFRISNEYIEKEIKTEKEMPGILRQLILDGADIFEAETVYPKLEDICSEIIRKGRNRL